MNLKDPIFIFLTNIAGQLINVLTVYFAVRAFSPENFGYVTIVTSLFAFFTFFTDLSFGVTHIKKMSESKENENLYFTTYFCIKLILTLIISLIIFLVMEIQITNKIISITPIQSQILGIYFFTSILSNINQVYNYSFQAKLKIAKIQFPLFINHLIKGLIQLLAIFFFNNFIIFVLGVLGGNVINCAISIFFGRKYRFVRPKWSIFRQYFQFSVILIIPSIISLSMQNLGPFIFIQYYDLDLLGAYNIIIKLTFFIFIIQNAFSLLYLPSFSSLIASGNLKKLKSEVEFYERIMLILWGFFIIIFFTSGPLLIRILFGDFYYYQGTPFFLFSIFVTISWGLWSPYGSLLIASGDLKTYLYLSINSLIFTILGWIIFIPIFGLIGMSLGSYLAYIINVPVTRRKLYKKFSIGKPRNKIFILILIGLIFTGIGIILQINKTLVTNIFGTVIIVLLELIIYLISIFLFKIITKEEIKKVKKTLNPRDFIKYIKDDILILD